MRPIEDFLEKLCISKMNESNTRNWKCIAEDIQQTLDAIPILRDKAFTPHDFSHHCYNIYRIISDVLLFQQSVGISEELKSESLYLLNIAILFHDFSMTRPNFSRDEHSKESEDMFYEYCEKTGTNRITARQRRIIGAIIYAHSDIKEKNVDGEIRTKEITIKSKRLTDEQGDVQGIIKVRFLAGLLRLADELDLTYDRAEGCANQIKYLDYNDRDQAFSIRCWEQLQCFEKIYTDNNCIKLLVNSEKFYEDTYKAKSLIDEVISKASESLTLISEECFQGDLFRLVRCSKILPDFSLIPIGNESGNECTLQISKKMAEVKETSDRPIEETCVKTENIDTNKSSQEKYYVVNPNFSDELDLQVLKENCFVGGHFNINSKLCSRDWIETKHIINDKVFRERICNEIKNHMKQRWIEKNLSKTLLVGIEEYGALLASSIAFDLKLPLSYIIPEKTQQNHSMQDKKFCFEGDTKIILFTVFFASTFYRKLQIIFP